MASLSEIFARYPDTDKGTIHSYDTFYEKLFADVKESNPSILLEIGVRGGGSLLAWRDWLSGWEIAGIDNGSEAGIWKPPEDIDVVVFEGDTTKPDTISEFINCVRLGLLFNATKLDLDIARPFGIIIDDGLHHPYSQAAAFAMLYPYVKRGGYYVIEDVEDIGFAETLARMFGGTVEDRRHVKGRHDDILVWWKKP